MSEINLFHNKSDNYKWRALGIVMIGTFMAILDSSIVNVAMPKMMASFGTNLDKVRWVATAYMMAYGVVVLTTDFLGRRFGQERVYLSALVLFTFGSFFCGRAWDINSMIAFRAFQAIGGGLMLPTGMTIITGAFKPSERGSAFGIFGMVILLAPVLGPTLGGYLVDSIGWSSIFLINIPVGILGTFLGLSTLDFQAVGESFPFDWYGFCGLSTALTAFLLAISQGERWGWNETPTIICFALTAVGFYIFIISELYFENPIINLSIFSDITLVLLFIMSFLRAVTLFGRTLFLTLFMQTLMGYSALSAGFYLIPGAIVAGICTPIFGKLYDRVGCRVLIIPGFFITALSFWLYRNLSVNSPYSVIFWPMILLGVGMAALSSPMMSSAMNVTEPKFIGMVSILQTVLMQLGGAYGINYLETVINSRISFHFQYLMEGFTTSVYNHTGSWVPGHVSQFVRNTPDSLMQTGVYLNAQKIAAAWSYDDAFVIMCILCLIALVVAFFLNEPKRQVKISDEPVVEIG